MVDGKSSRTKIFSQNMIYMFCLYHFSLKCIIKKIIYPCTVPLKLYLIVISMEYCPIVGNTVHRNKTYHRK